MLKNTIKFAFKIFKQERFFTSINILGLSLGFAICILLLGYVTFEYSYENHIENKDQVYRVTTTRYINTKKVFEGTRGPSSLALVAPADIPGIKYASRAFYEPCLIRTEDKKFASQQVCWVDSDFLNVFKGILIEGNPNTALDAPLKIVLTVSKAKALFGNVNPIGKTVKINEGMPFVVTGIVKDPPKNTHLKYDYLTTLETFVYYGWNNEKGNWERNNRYNYIAIDKTVNPKTITSALNQLALKHINPKKTGGKRLEFDLQPIQQIHLNSHYTDEPEVNGDLNQIYTIIGIGIAILLIVFINFINLSTTLSLRRAKNTGVQKTLGASKFQLKLQYFIESFLLNLSAVLIASIIVFISHSYLENFFQIALDFSILLSVSFWFWAVLIFAACVFAISFYPAFVLTSVDINLAIKGKITNGKTSHSYVKQGLLIGQFCASIFLTVGAYVVYQQVQFMQNYDLGINTNQVLVLRSPTSLNADSWNNYKQIAIKTGKYDFFKQELLKNAAIKDVASCYNIPGEKSNFIHNNIKLKKAGDVIQTKVEQRNIDESFFSVYEAKIVAGENFKRDYTQKKRETIINEKARKILGFKSAEDAIGEIVLLNNNSWKIKGVVSNIHMKAISEPMLPSFFTNKHPPFFGYYLVKLSPKNLKQQMAFIESKWKEIYPEDPFTSYFSNDYFNKQYIQYQQFGNIFNALTILAILIANLGLLAMVSLTTTEKLKEIAIRRVLGANDTSVFVLMSKGFLFLIAIAACLAIPLAWYFLTHWLNNFAYHIELQSIVFITAVLLILVIAIFNITYYVLKVLKYNPATIIKEE